MEGKAESDLFISYPCDTYSPDKPFGLTSSAVKYPHSLSSFQPFPKLLISWSKAARIVDTPLPDFFPVLLYSLLRYRAGPDKHF